MVGGVLVLVLACEKWVLHCMRLRLGGVERGVSQSDLDFLNEGEYLEHFNTLDR
jgi:hypothetical protein